MNLKSANMLYKREPFAIFALSKSAIMHIYIYTVYGQPTYFDVYIYSVYQFSSILYFLFQDFIN